MIAVPNVSKACGRNAFENAVQIPAAQIPASCCVADRFKLCWVSLTAVPTAYLYWVSLTAVPTAYRR